MELQMRHLRVLCAIADAGSVCQAAVRLGLPQPAVTHQLQRIERTAGVRVFDRGRNGTRPTPAGEVLLSRARVVLQCLDELIDDLERSGATTLTRVRVGCMPVPWSGRLVEPLREALNNADVALRSASDAAELVDQLADRRLELALVTEYLGWRTPRERGLLSRTLATEPLFVMLAADHPLASRAELELADFAAEQWLLSAPGEQVREAFFSVCGVAGFRPRIAHQLGDHSALPDFVAHGHGVGVVQPTCRQTHGVVVRPLCNGPLWTRQVLLWHESGQVAARAEQLAAAAAAAYQAAAEDAPAYREWLAHPDWDLR